MSAIITGVITIGAFIVNNLLYNQIPPCGTAVYKPAPYTCFCVQSDDEDE